MSLLLSYALFSHISESRCTACPPEKGEPPWSRQFTLDTATAPKFQPLPS